MPGFDLSLKDLQETGNAVAGSVDAPSQNPLEAVNQLLTQINEILDKIERLRGSSLVRQAIGAPVQAVQPMPLNPQNEIKQIEAPKEEIKVEVQPMDLKKYFQNEDQVLKMVESILAALPGEAKVTEITQLVQQYLTLAGDKTVADAQKYFALAKPLLKHKLEEYFKEGKNDKPRTVQK